MINSDITSSGVRRVKKKENIKKSNGTSYEPCNYRSYLFASNLDRFVNTPHLQQRGIKVSIYYCKAVKTFASHFASLFVHHNPPQISTHKTVLFPADLEVERIWIESRHIKNSFVPVHAWLNLTSSC